MSPVRLRTRGATRSIYRTQKRKPREILQARGMMVAHSLLRPHLRFALQINGRRDATDRPAARRMTIQVTDDVGWSIRVANWHKTSWNTALEQSWMSLPKLLPLSEKRHPFRFIHSLACTTHRRQN
jgi:hypothetical protein